MEVQKHTTFCLVLMSFLTINDISMVKALHQGSSKKSVKNETGFQPEGRRRVVRELDWEKLDNLRFMIRPDKAVTHYKVHSKSTGINENENYLGFTLYKLNGVETEAQGGLFHFVHEKDAIDQQVHCPPRYTRHAGAYRFIYGRCPENDTKMVASGYCFQKDRSYLFNSRTFNQKQSYMDKAYYTDENSYVVHQIEQAEFSKCLNKWKEDGYPTTSTWECEIPQDGQDNGMMLAVSSDHEDCFDCDTMSPCKVVTSAAAVHLMPLLLVTLPSVLML